MLAWASNSPRTYLGGLAGLRAAVPGLPAGLAMDTVGTPDRLAGRRELLGAAVVARTRGSCRWVYQDECVQRPARGDFGPGLAGRTPPQETPLARGGVSLDHADFMSSGSWYSLHGEAPWYGRSGPRDLMDVRANFGSATSNAGQLASDDDGASMRRPDLSWSDCPVRIPTARGPRGHRRRCRGCWIPTEGGPGRVSGATARGLPA